MANGANRAIRAALLFAGFVAASAAFAEGKKADEISLDLRPRRAAINGAIKPGFVVTIRNMSDRHIKLVHVGGTAEYADKYFVLNLYRQDPLDKKRRLVHKSAFNFTRLVA